MRYQLAMGVEEEKVESRERKCAQDQVSFGLRTLTMSGCLMVVMMMTRCLDDDDKMVG